MTTRKSKSDKPPRRTRASSTLRTQVESLLADGGREKEPIRLTELQSKLEELTRSDPQKAEQDRIALERGGADLPSSRMIRAQKAEQDRIALERLSAELEEHTPPDRRRSTLELASDVLENEPLGGRRRRVQASTLELASDVLENPGEWLRTSNTQLGNRRPIDLMGTEEEEKVFDLLHAVDQGLF